MVDVKKLLAKILDRGVFKDSNNNVTLDGSVTTAGNLTVGGHTSPIGTILTSHLASAKSVNASTGTALCSISLPKGTWDVVGYVRFPSNSSGYRLANINITSGSSSAHVMQTPLSGTTTQMQVKAIISVTGNSTTYYLNVYHTSSTALTMPAGSSDGYINGIRAARIA